MHPVGHVRPDLSTAYRSSRRTRYHGDSDNDATRQHRLLLLERSTRRRYPIDQPCLDLAASSSEIQNVTVK